MKKFTGGPGDDDDLAEVQLLTAARIFTTKVGLIAKLIQFADEDGDDGEEQDTNALRARWQHYFSGVPSYLFQMKVYSCI